MILGDLGPKHLLGIADTVADEQVLKSNSLPPPESLPPSFAKTASGVLAGLKAEAEKLLTTRPALETAPAVDSELPSQQHKINLSW